MPTTRSPRHGSMQFWPRKRSKRAYARVRAWPQLKNPAPVGFGGYKVGMTTVFVDDQRKHSKNKGQTIAIPVTIVECPPLKVASVRFYKEDAYGRKVVKEVFPKADKELGKKLPVTKKDVKLEGTNPKEYSDIRINVYTQPKMTSLGKKKPEIFEVALGGSIEEKFNYAKEHLGKEIRIGEVFKEGDLLDTHAVSTGKGFQGPVKRFGVGFRNHNRFNALVRKSSEY